MCNGCKLCGLPDGRLLKTGHLCGGHMGRVGLLFAVVVLVSAPLLAQVPTGTISGTVTDQVAAVLPKATVTVTNKATGAARTVQTGADGGFSVPLLPAGDYNVLIEATGFQPAVSDVEVATG